MSAMLGRIEAYGDRTCGCCYLGKSKRSLKRQEREDWRKDQLATLAPSFHEEQYEMSDWDWDGAGSYDASDLEGIPRVYCDMGLQR